MPLLLLLLIQTPQITLDPNGVFRATGLSDLAKTTLTVTIDAADVPPLLGEQRIDGNSLIFAPRYPIQPGLRYRAILMRGSGPPIVKIFEIPKAHAEPTTFVENVFPTAAVLPENQLKLYIQFSAPMSRGEVYNRTHLIDENGSRIVLPFLELPEELWDQEYRRLTILFDPGRIKRGLIPNEEVGSPLRIGKKYTLIIDPEWIDAEGRPLKTGFTKSFTVGPADRKVIELQNWTIHAPRAGGRAALAVEFPESLDHALLSRHLEVLDPAGEPAAGTTTIDKNEMRWQFIPDSAWKPGAYSLRVGTVLADLAGNMVDRLFDVDVFDKVDERIVREVKLVPFTIN